ncbi:hypothetical protein X777_15110 [Ooceraea biroi]|uniref:Uncharacterized protein n=1 Tax=Ooceraea biroi TaxID=2015173 RepID=A0A026WWI5_OOCBI|nr:hypothetical protein X777_15110 [Ooceraea biroi]
MHRGDTSFFLLQSQSSISESWQGRCYQRPTKGWLTRAVSCEGVRGVDEYT